MRTRWFATLGERHGELFCHDSPEVTLSHFAAMAGLTREQYAGKIIRYARSGRVLELLSADAAGRLIEWILSRESYDARFCLTIRTALNSDVEHAFFLECRCEGTGVTADEVTEGVIGFPPDGVRGLESFEVMFCDLDAGPGGLY